MQGVAGEGWEEGAEACRGQGALPQWGSLWWAGRTGTPAGLCSGMKGAEVGAEVEAGAGAAEAGRARWVAEGLCAGLRRPRARCPAWETQAGSAHRPAFWWAAWETARASQGLALLCHLKVQEVLG